MKGLRSKVVAQLLESPGNRLPIAKVLLALKDEPLDEISSTLTSMLLANELNLTHDRILELREVKLTG